jgi:uncharacterized damage-inducible protein DinB
MSTSPDNPKTDEIRHSVQSSYTELNQLIDGPLAVLDPAKLYQIPAENEWTIMQNLAHIIEFTPYWAGEIEKLITTPGANFGRSIQDERRLRAISEHSSDSLKQIKAALPDSYTRLEQLLSKLKDSDLALTGLHPRYGEKPLDGFIEDFVTGHLKGHVEQIKAAMAAVE